ncbi:MAG: hypothetical protein A3F09_02825 [Chlamydiae bacterium RIFCSPHIGHO2_12_FULL_49_11]|nr:MAG: hypothetical protein A3F09_02825 [Chlamydiae bacterium RIFCSPHIGHO2_12_FULL_49_11]
MEPISWIGAGERSRAVVPQTRAAGEEYCEALARRSLALWRTEARTLARAAPVTIIQGTSSVGKSSLIAAMRASNAELRELGVDILGHQRDLDYIKTQHPQTYALLDALLIPKERQMHILHAVRGGVFHFKPTVTKSEREDTERRASIIADEVARAAGIGKEDIDHVMLDKAMTYALGNISVVFDILNIERVFAHHLGRIPLCIALIFCPLDTLVARIQRRNREALRQQDMSEIRPDESPLLQLGKIFRPKTAPDEKILFSITRKQLIEAFNVLFEEGAKIIHASYSAGEREERLDKVMRALGFINSSIKELHYTPRFNGYDYVIDTSVTDVRGAATILVRK